MKISCLMAASAMLLTLGACNLPPQYTPPSTLTSQTAATITGSAIESGSIFSPSTNVDLLSIDNKSAFAQKDAILVAPGTHVVTASICQCGVMTSNMSGTATLIGDFKPGGKYTIRTNDPTNAPGFNKKSVTVWIEDSTGVPITPKTKFIISVPLPPIAKLFTNG
jgi:hypothetical protein